MFTLSKKNSGLLIGSFISKPANNSGNLFRSTFALNFESEPCQMMLSFVDAFSKSCMALDKYILDFSFLVLFSYNDALAIVNGIYSLIRKGF